jgi:hypothetical protein
VIQVKILQDLSQILDPNPLEHHYTFLLFLIQGIGELYHLHCSFISLLYMFIDFISIQGLITYQRDLIEANPSLLTPIKILSTL